MLLWNALEDGPVRVNAHEDGRIESYRTLRARRNHR
jgi:hypothetical protein